VLDTQAATHAEAGRFPDALTNARRALDMAVQQNDYALADTLRAHITAYEVGKPYRQR
jgi:hypothetical protein